jgi:hypothetical protein
MITKALVWCDTHHQLEEWRHDSDQYFRYSRLEDGKWEDSGAYIRRFSGKTSRTLEEYVKENKELTILYAFRT